jgi:hypothetical protein
MAGDANAGGGGSVYWSVDVNNGVDADITSTKSNGHHHQRGKDNDGVAGQDSFIVTIRVPQDQTDADSYVNYLKTAIQPALDNAHVFFTVPIEYLGPGDDHKQINLKWGDQSGGFASHGTHGTHGVAKHAKNVRTKAGKKR